MCKLHWCYKFAPVLHLKCTTLSLSESSNFFMYIINHIIKQHKPPENTRLCYHMLLCIDLSRTL